MSSASGFESSGSEAGLPALHLSGPVLIGPDQLVAEAWVIGGRLTYSAPVSPGLVVRTLPGWVIPGLVDAHCHVGLGPEGAVDVETARAQAEADRDAGTLLIRDAGQPGDTRWIDDAGDLPVIIRAGRHIARSRRYLRNYGHEIEPELLADYVRAEAERGDGWVKLVGDWIDRDLGDLAPCWPADALVAAMAAAHAKGARVTAHCFGEDCLPDLLDAGIDCIEHGTGLTPETIDLAAGRGVAIVPTLINTLNFSAFAGAAEEKFPAYAARMRRLEGTRYSVLRDAHDAGVPLYAGTDAGGSLAHGQLAVEVAELVAAGLTAVAALDAACWGARSWLGRSGLEEGASADLVLLDEDPRQDVRVLASPRAVVLRGRVVHFR